MRRVCLALLGICCVGISIAAAQELPRATQLPGKPFFIKKTWIIGGEGNWDYLTLDPNALQLFVAHGTSVQVVDVSAGALAGQINGMRDAHGIALDDSGQLGFISDGGANRVRIFDRRTLQVIASAPTGPNPRAIVYEPLTKLVFAVCAEPITDGALAQLEAAAGQPQQHPAPTEPNPHSPRGGSSNRSTAHASDEPATTSVISVIDASNNKTLGHLLVPGHLGFALADGRGEIYINVIDRGLVVHFDAQSLLALMQQQAASNHAEPVTILNWSDFPNRFTGSRPQSLLQWLRLAPDCRFPKSLAIDGDNRRIFVACDNQKLNVLNTDTGQSVANLTIGPGTDAIGYDASRGLIYTANGGGLGSLTVIRRDVADGYAVIQDLPTKQRARTLAVNPTNGEVYLVTNLEGFDLNRKGDGGGAHTLPVVQATPVHGSFQVLVIGN
jgi:DNA-binding beta-propeller fold protein YncE